MPSRPVQVSNCSNNKVTIIKLKNKKIKPKANKKQLSKGGLKNVKAKIETVRVAKVLDEDTSTFKTFSTTLEFRNLIIQSRIAKKLNQKELALRIGVNQSEIQKWESGKLAPNGLQKTKLQKILNIKLPKIKKPKNV